MITDYAQRNVKVMGFILYRKKYGEEKITILDIIFYNDRDAMDKFYPEFNDINITQECIQSFSEFIDEIQYKCVWRPAIKLNFRAL